MNSNINFTPRKPAEIKPIKASDIITSQILYLLIAFYAPIALFFDISSTPLQVVSIAAAAASIIIFAKLSRSTRTAVSYSLILVAAFALVGPVLCGLVASFIGSVCAFSYSLIKAKKLQLRLFAISPALIAYLAASAMLGNFVLALIALAHVPAALALGYSFSKGLDRVSSICRTSAAIILTTLLPAVAYFLVKYGTDLSVLSSLVDSLKSSTTNLLADTLYKLYSGMTELGVSMSMTDALDVSTYTVNAIFNLLPALIVLISNVISFSLQSMLTSILIVGETDKAKISKMLIFEMSLISAVVFIISFVAMLILSASDISVWSVTAENIAIILMPGLLFSAFAAFRGFIFLKNSSCLGALLYLISVILIFYIPAIMIPLASFAGAVLIILNNISKYRSNHKK